MAKIHILGGGHRLIYRLIKKSVFFELIDHFIRVSSLPKTPPVGGHSLLCRPLTETTVVASAAIARPW